MKKQLAKTLALGGAISGATTGASVGGLFGGVGAPIGAAVGFIGGAIGSIREKREERRREKKQLAQMQEMEKEQRLLEDETKFRDYAGGQGRGFDLTGFYKLGGSMKLAKPDILGVRQDPSHGGYIDDTASNAGIVRGRSHESGGVKLPGAEVEGQESIVQSPFTGETQVHSDELGIADQTNQLIQRKGELEDKLTRLQDKMAVIELDLNTQTTTIRRNSFKRQYDNLREEAEQYASQIAEINTQVEQLYQQQEGIKEQAGRSGLGTQGAESITMGQEQPPIMQKGGQIKSDTTRADSSRTWTSPFWNERGGADIDGARFAMRNNFVDSERTEGWFSNIPLQEYIHMLGDDTYGARGKGIKIPDETLNYLYDLPDTEETRQQAQDSVRKYIPVRPGDEQRYGGKLPKLTLGGTLLDRFSSSRLFNTDFSGVRSALTGRIAGKPPSIFVSPRERGLKDMTTGQETGQEIGQETGVSSGGTFFDKVAGFFSGQDGEQSKVADFFSGQDGEQSKFGQLAETAAPFMDNIYNVHLNKKLRNMDIPEPTMDRPIHLDPEYDVSSQLADIDQYKTSTTRGITEGTSDSRVGRGLASEVGARAAGMRGRVMTEKLNQERAVRNQNRQITQEVSARNVERVNQHQMAQFDKDIQTDITAPSQNMAQVRDEIIGILDRRDMRDYQDKQLAIQELLTRAEGIFGANFGDMFTEEEKERLRKQGAKI